MKVTLLYKRTTYTTLMLCMAISCIEPYQPPEITQTFSPLVVDGFLNVNGISTIKLSRTQNLTDKGNSLPEYNATVIIETESGDQYNFLDTKNVGAYVLPNQNLSTEKIYRLRIKTIDNKEYASDYLSVKLTPPIDSVIWKINEDKSVNIFVSTDDPTGKSKFYSWTYKETWEYLSAYQSTIDYLPPNTVVNREQDIYRCYQLDIPSQKISIASSQGLLQDKISEYSLLHIPWASERTSIKYSIQVIQRVISKEEYEYLLQLQKNTESSGTLFDPLPSQIVGNIRSLSEMQKPVLGYFDVGSTTEKRIFIPSSKLSRSATNYDSPFKNCSYDTLLLENVSNFIDISKSKLLIGPISQLMGPGIIGYSFSTIDCVDCRSAGGVLNKPDFWD